MVVVVVVVVAVVVVMEVVVGSVGWWWKFLFGLHHTPQLFTLTQHNSSNPHPPAEVP